MNTSPRLKARTAAVFYFVAVLTAVFFEFFAPGKFDIAAMMVPVSCYAVVTLLLYAIFNTVSRSTSLLMAGAGLIGLILEVLLWQPRGINLAMVFHGFYCLMLGALVLRSKLLPRILGGFMLFAGLVWLLYLSPELSERLSPYNTAAGLLGEAALMLWLLVMGVNEMPQQQPAVAAEQRRTPMAAHQGN